MMEVIKKLTFIEIETSRELYQELLKRYPSSALIWRQYIEAEMTAKNFGMGNGCIIE